MKIQNSMPVIFCLLLLLSSCQSSTPFDQDQAVLPTADGDKLATLAEDEAPTRAVAEERNPGQEVNPAQEAQLGAPFIMGIGDTAVLDLDLQLTLQAVYDSRCPTNAQCIQAGWAEVVLGVKEGDGPTQTVQLFFSADRDDKPDTVKVSGYSITVVNVTPYPSLEQGVKEAQQATLLVK
jgi:hypothetical protein